MNKMERTGRCTCLTKGLFNTQKNMLHVSSPLILQPKCINVCVRVCVNAVMVGLNVMCYKSAANAQSVQVI